VVCRECFNKINGFYSFYETVLENKNRLKDIVKEAEKPPPQQQANNRKRPNSPEPTPIFQGEFYEDPNSLPKARKPIFMSPEADKLMSETFKFICSSWTIIRQRFIRNGLA
jgi:hypothetical protein